MIRLVVGLGNPGKEYERTRHNAGFWLVEKYAQASGFALRKAIVAFMLAFDSNFAPIVGQQITMTQGTAAAAGIRLDLLEARAAQGECDLVAKSTSTIGPNLGALYVGGSWKLASTTVKPISDGTLRSKIASGALPPVTFTCVPAGSGRRIAIDRDGDGYADWDEVAAKKNPNDPTPIHGGFALAHFNGDPALEAKIKDDLGVTVRCIPLDANAQLVHRRLAGLVDKLLLEH